MNKIPQTQKQRKLGIESYYEKDDKQRWIIKTRRVPCMELNASSEVPTREKFSENKNWFQANLHKAIQTLFEKKSVA